MLQALWNAFEKCLQFVKSCILNVNIVSLSEMWEIYAKYVARYSSPKTFQIKGLLSCFCNKYPKRQQNSHSLPIFLFAACLHTVRPSLLLIKEEEKKNTYNTLFCSFPSIPIHLIFVQFACFFLWRIFNGSIVYKSNTRRLIPRALHMPYSIYLITCLWLSKCIRHEYIVDSRNVCRERVNTREKKTATLVHIQPHFK